MNLTQFVQKYYKGEVKPLEAFMIADAIKTRQWQDFHHTWKERLIFTFASFFLA